MPSQASRRMPAEMIPSSIGDLKKRRKPPANNPEIQDGSIQRALAEAESEARRQRLEAQEQRARAERADDVVAVARRLVRWGRAQRKKGVDLDPKLRALLRFMSEALLPIVDEGPTELEAAEDVRGAPESPTERLDRLRQQRRRIDDIIEAVERGDRSERGVA